MYSFPIYWYILGFSSLFLIVPSTEQRITQCNSQITVEHCTNTHSVDCAWCPSSQKCVPWNVCKDRPVNREDICPDAFVMSSTLTKCSKTSLLQLFFVLLAVVAIVILAVVGIYLLLRFSRSCSLSTSKASYNRLGDDPNDVSL